MIKYPPIAKIYEAYTCIADNRVEFYENEAIVVKAILAYLHVLKNLMH